jgi:hypothetical protein
MIFFSSLPSVLSALVGVPKKVARRGFFCRCWSSKKKYHAFLPLLVFQKIVTRLLPLLVFQKKVTAFVVCCEMALQPGIVRQAHYTNKEYYRKSLT